MLIISETQMLNNLLTKYQKITKNTSYVKYNFIIELINNNDNKLNIEYTIQEKKQNQSKIPLKYLNKKKTFDINHLFFLINDNFNTDINQLLIYQTNNISTIYNGVIIDMNNYTIICNPDKNYIYSRFNTFKKYNDDDIMYEYDIYKLYDGNVVNLYYNDNDNIWVLSDNKNININNKLFDNINNDTYWSFFIQMIYEYKVNIDNLNKKNTYIFYLINKNYNLSSQKNKIKFITYNSNNGIDNNFNQEELELNNIKIKQLYSIHAKSTYGLLFRSKNNLENRLIFFEYYQKIKKIIYTPINNKINSVPDLKYITIRAILKYKISKNDVFNTFQFLIKYYKYIMSEIDKIIELFLLEFPDFNNIQQKYKYFIIKINNDIKNNKSLNDIFYNNYILQKDTNEDNIYNLTLRDYILQPKYINEFYNILF
tara:strand:+ start:3910 stop:5187 length:1278 start_codon:yes stop_codon:yes gene_type:complete